MRHTMLPVIGGYEVDLTTRTSQQLQTLLEAAEGRAKRLNEELEVLRVEIEKRRHILERR